VRKPGRHRYYYFLVSRAVLWFSQTAFCGCRGREQNLLAVTACNDVIMAAGWWGGRLPAATSIFPATPVLFYNLFIYCGCERLAMWPATTCGNCGSFMTGDGIEAAVRRHDDKRQRGVVKQASRNGVKNCERERHENNSCVCAACALAAAAIIKREA